MFRLLYVLVIECVGFVIMLHNVHRCTVVHRRSVVVVYRV